MPLRQRAFPSTALTLVAILLAGCGGSAAPAPPSTSVAAAGASTSSSAVATPAASTASSAPVSSGTGQSIKVSIVQASAGFAPAWLGQDEGIFKKYGLNAEVIRIAPPSDTQALISGDVQFSIAGSAGLGALANGADIPYIGLTAPLYLQSLYSQTSISKISELVGKKVGTSTKGGPSHLALLTLLQRAGIDPSSVDIAFLRDDTTILAALTSGQLQAAVITSPNTLLARQAGLRELQDMAPLKIPTLTQGIEVRRDWAQQHQGVVQSFLQAYLEAIKVDRTDENLTKATISKWTGLKDQALLDEAYKRTLSAVAPYPLVRDEAVQDALNLSTDPKVKSHPPSFYYDNSYLEKLQSFVQGLYPQGIPQL